MTHALLNVFTAGIERMLLVGTCAINCPESMCQKEASCQHSNPRKARLGLLQQLSVPSLQHNTQFFYQGEQLLLLFKAPEPHQVTHTLTDSPG